MPDDDFTVVHRKKGRNSIGSGPTVQEKEKTIRTEPRAKKGVKPLQPMNPLPQSMNRNIKTAKPAVANSKPGPPVKLVKKYCAFFPLPQGCTKGDKCPFRHEVPNLDDALDRDRVCKFANACVIEEKDGTCANGPFCPFVHKNTPEQPDSKPAEQRRAFPPATPSTTCSLSPSASQRKPRRQEEPELPRSEERIPEDEGTSHNGLVNMRAVFGSQYDAPAQGYLSAAQGQEVEILYEQDEWYFGRTDTDPDGGWFPKSVCA